MINKKVYKDCCVLCNMEELEEILEQLRDYSDKYITYCVEKFREVFDKDTDVPYLGKICSLWKKLCPEPYATFLLKIAEINENKGPNIVEEYINSINKFFNDKKLKQEIQSNIIEVSAYIIINSSVAKAKSYLKKVEDKLKSEIT